MSTKDTEEVTFAIQYCKHALVRVHRHAHEIQCCFFSWCELVSIKNFTGSNGSSIYLSVLSPKAACRECSGKTVQENSGYAVILPEYFSSFQGFKAQGVSKPEESSLYFMTPSVVLPGRCPVAPFAVSCGKELHSWTMEAVKAASCCI